MDAGHGCGLWRRRWGVMEEGAGVMKVFEKN